MRTFLPLTPADFFQPAPPNRPARTVRARDDATDSQGNHDIDVRMDEALNDAAFESLSLIFDDETTVPCRVVAVGDQPEHGGFSSWDQFDSFHVDGPELLETVEAARQAASQEELDRLVSQITSASLEWFDVSEFAALKERFAADMLASFPK